MARSAGSSFIASSRAGCGKGGDPRTRNFDVFPKNRDAVDIRVGQAFPGFKANLWRERAEEQRHQVAVCRDDQDVLWSSEERINRRTPTRHGRAARFPTGPRQIEIHKTLADRLAPLRQRRCGEHALCESGLDLDGEAQPLGEWGDGLLCARMGTRYEQIHPHRLQIVCEADGLCLSDGSERCRGFLPSGLAMTH